MQDFLSEAYYDHLQNGLILNRVHMSERPETVISEDRIVEVGSRLAGVTNAEELDAFWREMPEVDLLVLFDLYGMERLDKIIDLLFVLSQNDRNIDLICRSITRDSSNMTAVLNNFMYVVEASEGETRKKLRCVEKLIKGFKDNYSLPILLCGKFSRDGGENYIEVSREDIEELLEIFKAEGRLISSRNMLNYIFDRLG